MKFSAFEIIRYLFGLTVAILVVLCVGSLLRIGDNPERSGLYIFYSAVFFGDALLFGVCAWQLPKRTKFIFYFSIFVLAVNIIPTIFDQFGLADLLFVLLNVATLFSLITSRREFLTV